jgi:aldose 1-epimerase
MSVPADPVRLSRTFAGRRVDALVSPLGASVQALVVEGLSLVWGDPRGPVSASGAVLAPWPNRVRAGRWTHDGQVQQLDVTEPAAGNAIHGLVASTPFAVTGFDGSSVELATRVSRPTGYPFDLDVIVSYRLSGSGIESTITVVNRTETPAPVAVGVHPYVRVGDATAASLRVQIDADTTMLLARDNLPSGTVPVGGTPFDVRIPTPIASAPAHAAYTGLRAHQGRVGLRLDDGEGGNAVRVWADERFRWAQLYVTDAFPGLTSDGVAVALEPMTAPPDAFNSGDELHWMLPGERWALDWGIERL